jgi:hypothetical protein
MPQHDMTIADADGATVLSDLNAAFAALGSTQKGPNAPPAPIAGMLWFDDNEPSVTVWTLKCYDGADWITVGTLDSTTNLFAPANAVARAGDTMTGDLTVSKATPAMTLRKAASGQSAGVFGQTGAANRWQMEFGGSDAEAGSNAGSSWRLNRFSDGGSFLGTVLEFRRSDGRATVLPPGIAPQPQAAAGVGEWRQIGCADGAAMVLPAGGTWAYLLFNFTSANAFTGTVLGSVAAGGTTLVGGVAGFYFTGLGWRIA